MSSVILRTTARALRPTMLLVSLFLLLRGHQDPGGGFAGGLVAAAAFGLQSMAEGVEAVRRTLRIDPRSLAGAGLVVALASGLAPLATGRPLLTGMWTRVHLPVLGELDLGTPLLFDAGVYLLVAGAALMVFLALEEA